jgi:hypothetical protein
MLTKLTKLLLSLAATALLLLPATVQAATEEQIENAVEDGLAWLATQQQTSGAWQYDDGSPSSADVATTALVVLKLEDRARELGVDPFDPEEYAYADNLIAGLNYLFENVSTDAEGRVYVPDYDTYNTGAAMMAVASSNAPGRVITTGPLASSTFQQALEGMLDWMAFAQNEEPACALGGWGYYANQTNWSDQSNSGYATLGLGFAAAHPPAGFGLTIPPEVLLRLSTYVDNVQDPVDGDDYHGGSWYEPCTSRKWVNVLKTGNLLYEMALVGDAAESLRVQNAIAYIEDHWNDTGPQPEFTYTSLGWKDSYQAMFTMMKGFEAFGIDTIDVGTEIEWFDEVSDVIVANQEPDGWFAYLNPAITEGEQSRNLRTAWALLTLERVVPEIVKPLDHFKCYAVTPLNGAPKFEKRSVVLEDQFGLEDHKVLVPQLLCNPVSKDGSELVNPAAHLVCYEIDNNQQGPKNEKPEVQTTDQFGELMLRVVTPRMLCVPAAKEVLSPTE